MHFFVLLECEWSSLLCCFFFYTTQDTLYYCVPPKEIFNHTLSLNSKVQMFFLSFCTIFQLFQSINSTKFSSEKNSPSFSSYAVFNICQNVKMPFCSCYTFSRRKKTNFILNFCLSFVLHLVLSQFVIGCCLFVCFFIVF